jgi:hypothetical protein
MHVVSLTAREGFVVGDADVLEHVGVAGDHRAAITRRPTTAKQDPRRRAGSLSFFIRAMFLVTMLCSLAEAGAVSCVVVRK